MKNWFYQKNSELIKSPVNKTFDDVLQMGDSEFSAWVASLCSEVTRIWDELGIPPRVGVDEDEIKHQFSKMRNFPIYHPINGFECVDVDTGEPDCIRNTSTIGTCVNQWFPTMLTTKIVPASNSSEPLSIYDHFKIPKYFDKMVHICKNNFQRDSFSLYSTAVKKFLNTENLREYLTQYHIKEDSAQAWVSSYESNRKFHEKSFDYWIQPIERKPPSDLLTMTQEDLDAIVDRIPEHCKKNVDSNTANFFVRVYEKNQHIFPLGIKAFRVSICQYAANFPPLVAKYIYEKLSDEFKDQDKILIWDPSAGWGGRILGAMSVENDTRKIHYIGTDPNTDHNTENGRTKYHELADYYNKHTTTIFSNPTHTYEIYQCGSEDMRNQESFHKYRGKLDIVFTSPPYFSKETYSTSETQSTTKFTTFDAWVDGFLKPTLETAVEWLAPNRYLLWNISDVKIGGEVLPLEKVSNDILRSLGMEYVKTLKMLLAQHPNQKTVREHVHEGDNSTYSNFCRVLEPKKGAKLSTKSTLVKYEPIFVYRKV